MVHLYKTFGVGNLLLGIFHRVKKKKKENRKETRRVEKRYRCD